MKNKNDIMHPNSSILLYQTEDGKTKLEVRLENETVWITIEQMAIHLGAIHTSQISFQPPNE
jgi:hypothetical protein